MKTKIIQTARHCGLDPQSPKSERLRVKPAMTRLLLVVIIALGFASCEDFLNRPDKSAYTLETFYKSDDQLLQAANILYNSPWHDFTRGYLGVGDVMSGNLYQGSNGYWKLTLKDGSVNQDLQNMAAALWSVNARANTILENINLHAGGAATPQGIRTAKGEVLVWKAMAYFYMVRIYGGVPIIHNNSELLASGEYNTMYRAKINNVYDYIIKALEKAIEWLPEKNKEGRIDKYSACGLLAKVYLTKSGYGRSGDRNQDDLDKAKQYAAEVVKNSGRVLEPNYEDIFRGSHKFTPEGLISWRWISDNSWTCANPIQSDLGLTGFDEFACWGDWRGPSIDLQNAFGENALNVSERKNSDTRRKATMMMYGDVYPYFWRDKPTKEGIKFSNGFDWTKYLRDVRGEFGTPTGANCVKHLVGDNADHVAELGTPMVGQMATSLPTHILRLADVYLVYAEAILGNAASTTNKEALDAFNAVRRRAAANKDTYVPVTSINFEDIFKERRLELAIEGDFWYDFVRLSYYKPDDALDRLKKQERRAYTYLSDYFMQDSPTITTDANTGLKSPRIDEATETGQSAYTMNQLQVPFPEFDLLMNPNLMKDPIDYDISNYTFE